MLLIIPLNPPLRKGDLKISSPKRQGNMASPLSAVQWWRRLPACDFFPLTLTLSPIGGEGIKKETVLFSLFPGLYTPVGGEGIKMELPYCSS
jgi:hypothetical protein